jgi:DNA-binding transcriptional LysR family regulator
LNGNHAVQSDLRLDLNLFRVLDAVYIHGGISPAARALHLTQPAVTHALNRLRASFGDPLFVRQGNRMIPTERTRAVIAEVQLHLKGLQATARIQTEFRPELLEMRLVLGSRDTLESTVLPQLVAALTREAPRLAIVSRYVAVADVERELSASTVDLVIERRLPVGPRIVAEPVLDDSMVVVMRRDHPLSSGTLRRADYLGARHVAVASAGETSSVDVLLASDGRFRQIHLVCQHNFAACEIASMGDLLLTLPRSYAARLAALLPVAVRPLPLRIKPFPVVAYWHESRQHDRAHQWFRERVIDIVRDSLNASA